MSVVLPGRSAVDAGGEGAELALHHGQLGLDHVGVGSAVKGLRKRGDLGCVDVELLIGPVKLGGKALDHAFKVVGSGDLIVVQVDEVEPMLKLVMEHFERIVGTAPSAA